MSQINLNDYYKKHSNNKEWLKTLSRFPEELQREIIVERPDGSKEDIEEINGFCLNNPKPITVKTKDILNSTLKSDEKFLSRLPQEVVDVINKKWGVKGRSETVYDPNPDRYFKYAKMSSATAKPSILFDGVIGWGVGRFVASLIRGDETIKIWDIKSC